MDRNRGNWLMTATALFFSWAVLSLAVRAWVKLGRKQRWGSDDTVISVAFLTTVLHISSVFVAVQHGFGRPLAEMDANDDDILQGAMYTSELSYTVTVGMTRISTALFIANLTRHKPQVRMAYVLCGVAAFWTTASTIIVALRGNLAHPWSSLDGTEGMWLRWIVIETTGMAIEVGLWAMSLALVWGLQMKLRKRILILGAFGGRLLIAPILAARLYLLAPSQNHEPTWTSILPGILTEAALEYAIIATSITALKPFLRPFHTGAIVNSIGGAGSGLAYGSAAYRGHSVYIRSGSKSVDQKDDIQMTSRVDVIGAARDSGDELALRSGLDASQTTVAGVMRPRKEDEESVESHGSEKMIIRTTRNWSVRYEDR